MTRTEAIAVISGRLRITGQTYAHRDAIRAAGCAWDASTKSWYAPTEEIRAVCQSVVDGTLYNSPPPPDLTGDEDPATLAGKHGRTAVAGAKVVSFSCYGLAKGDNGKPNGSIRTVKGVRYVQVARSKRVYCSRDWLEDMDLFGKEPGGHYTWDGVPVEPTADEAAADKVATDKAAAAKAVAEAAIAQAKSESDARLAQWKAVTAGLVSCVCRPSGYQETGEQIVFGAGSIAKQIRLADGRLGWHHSIVAYDDYRDYYWVPEDVARTLCLDHAATAGITPEYAAEWLVKYSGCHGGEVYRAVMEADEGTQRRLREAAAEKQTRDAAIEAEKKHDWAQDKLAVQRIAAELHVDADAIKPDTHAEYVSLRHCRRPAAYQVTFGDQAAADAAPCVLALVGDAEFDACELQIIPIVEPKKPRRGRR